jgi:two-component system, OmpR family, response regulator CssR
VNADFTVGTLRIDLIQRRVFVAGEERELTQRPYDLLVALARVPGRAVSYDELYATVWKAKVPYTWRASRVMATTVRRLREQLGFDCVRTLWGYGLRLVEPQEEAA